MDQVKVAFGGFFLILGIISLFAYVTKAEYLFSKKLMMKSLGGNNAGTAIHFIKYVIIPIVFGASLIVTQLM